MSSLLRLILLAAVLCVAWILLSASQADAAERPRPEVSVTLKSLVAVVEPPAQALAPVLEQVRATSASTVAQGTEVVSAVAAPVPALEEPVSRVTQDVKAVVDVLPALVVPAPPVPPSPPVAPDAPAAPDGRVVADVSAVQPSSAMKQQSDSIVPQPSTAPSVVALLGSKVVQEPDGEVAASPPARTVVPVPSDRALGTLDGSSAPMPGSPPQRAPASPSGPPASSSSGATDSDWARVEPTSPMHLWAMLARGPDDWHAPFGQPEHPGTRPD